MSDEEQKGTTFGDLAKLRDAQTSVSLAQLAGKLKAITLQDHDVQALTYTNMVRSDSDSLKLAGTRGIRRLLSMENKALTYVDLVIKQDGLLPALVEQIREDPLQQLKSTLIMETAWVSNATSLRPFLFFFFLVI